MRRQQLSVKVSDGDPAVVPAGIINVLDDRRQTMPLAAFSGSPGSPRMPSTARTVDPTGALVAADDDDGWRADGLGCRPPEVSATSRRSWWTRNSSISLVPNSRFMNELLVIWPTQPARSPSLARAKNSAMNGTVSA